MTPAKARKLLGLGRPARFGRGEETLTDPDVRDTWEIPKQLVRAQWDDAALKVILATVKEELGLPDAAELTAIFIRCWSTSRTSTSSPTRTPRKTTRWWALWWSPCRPATPAAS